MIDDHWLKNEFKDMSDTELLLEIEFAETFAPDNLEMIKAEFKRREREKVDEKTE